MKFFDNLKEHIREVATDAVFEAEKIFGSNNGAAKKQAAIEFVLNALPVPSLLKTIIAIFLNAFIDAAIETAVETLNEKKRSQQDVPVHDENSVQQ